MTQDIQSYSLAVIRDLLTSAFKAEDLRRFCQDCRVFRPVVDRFGADAGLVDMVDEVIDYCETRLLFTELLAEVEDYNPRQYARFEPFLPSKSDALVDTRKISRRPADLVIELREWKQVHSDVQVLFDKVGIPLDYLTDFRSDPVSDPDRRSLDKAGFKWQELCVPALRSLPATWNFQLAYSPVLRDLYLQASRVDEITRQLMHVEGRGPEFDKVYGQLLELRGILWNVLTCADKRIAALLDALQPIAGGISP